MTVDLRLELLQVCQMLRMAESGASDPLHPLVRTKLLGILADKLATWDPPSSDQRARYDNAVKELIIATLVECGAL